MYIETSAPRRPGDKARLISPSLNGASQFCVTFYYHMYGPHINALNVHLAQNTTLGAPAWRRSGTQGNRWNKGTLQIPGGSASAAVTNVSLISEIFTFLLTKVQIGFRMGAVPDYIISIFVKKMLNVNVK